MGRTVQKQKIEELIGQHERRYERLHDMLKNGYGDGLGLGPEDESEIDAQMHEIGHFIDQLKELL